MAQTELVIFDCDGVLVDSEVIAIAIEAEVLTGAGFPLTSEEAADRFVGLSYSDMMATLSRESGRPVPSDVSEQVQRRTLEAFPEQLQPVRGIPELLDELELARCVASSSDLDRVRLSLDVTGLAKHFEPDHVFSAQMVVNGKPAPDLFLYAAASLGVEPASCLVVEDSPHGVLAAFSAGMKVVGFTAGAHARPSLTQRLSRAGAEIVVANASDLANHF